MATGAVIDPRMVSALRGVTNKTLPELAEVKRKGAIVRDGMGGNTAGETTVATLPCRKKPGGLRPEEREMNERLRNLTDWTVLFDAGADIRPTDALVIGGSRLEVVHAEAPISYEVLRPVVCVEVQ